MSWCALHSFWQDWDLMSKMCIYIYIHIHLWWYEYLLFVTYNMVCTGFVFGLEIIHRACGCSTPPFIPFFPRCGSAGDYETCCYVVLIYIELWRLYLYLEFIVEICNSYLSMHVTLKKKSHVLHSFESLCKAMWANHLLGRCLCN